MRSADWYVDNKSGQLLAHDVTDYKTKTKYSVVMMGPEAGKCQKQTASPLYSPCDHQNTIKIANTTYLGSGTLGAGSTASVVFNTWNYVYVDGMVTNSAFSSPDCVPVFSDVILNSSRKPYNVPFMYSNVSSNVSSSTFDLPSPCKP